MAFILFPFVLTGVHCMAACSADQPEKAIAVFERVFAVRSDNSDVLRIFGTCTRYHITVARFSLEILSLFYC